MATRERSNKEKERFSIVSYLRPHATLLNNTAFFAAGALTALTIKKVVWSRRKEPFYWWLGRTNHLQARPEGFTTSIADTISFLSQPSTNTTTTSQPAASSVLVNQILKRRGYAVGYSYAYKSPLWCSFIVSRAFVESGNEVVRVEPFAVDMEVPASCRPRVVDFLVKGLHRGHLAARATVGFSPMAAQETFLLSNVALMTPYCNGVAYSKVEALTREWARTLDGPLAVCCGPIFDQPPHKVLRTASPSSASSSITSGTSDIKKQGASTSPSLVNKGGTPTGTANSTMPKSPHHMGVPIANAFYYAVLHVPTGNSIGFIIQNIQERHAVPRMKGKRKSSSKLKTMEVNTKKNNCSSDHQTIVSSPKDSRATSNSASTNTINLTAKDEEVPLKTINGYSRKNVAVLTLNELEAKLSRVYSKRHGTTSHSITAELDDSPTNSYIATKLKPTALEEQLEQDAKDALPKASYFLRVAKFLVTPLFRILVWPFRFIFNFLTTFFRAREPILSNDIKLFPHFEKKSVFHRHPKIAKNRINRCFWGI